MATSPVISRSNSHRQPFVTALKPIRGSKLTGLSIALLCVICFGVGLLLTPAIERLQNRLRRVSRAAEAPPLDARLHARRRSQFALLKSADRIVLAGDSRIDEGEWDALLSREDVANRGISGDTTAGLLRRFDDTFPRAVDACVLQVGINDLMQGASIDQTEQNYRQLLQQIQDRNLAGSVIITSVILTGERSPELNQRIAQLNKRLIDAAAEPGLRWLDLNAALAPLGHLDKKYTNDGTHLTGDGYRVFAAALEPFVDQVPRRR